MSIMKVLLPIDDSEASQVTIKWAVDFLNPATTHIYLLHVNDPRLGTPFTEIVDKLLSDAAHWFQSHGYFVAQAEARTGLPADTICEYADEQDIQMVIMGSHGRRGVSKLLMGSVSSAVFKKAKQQVLILSNTPRPSITMPVELPDHVSKS